MKPVYLIDRFDRWCPENNNGEYIVKAFSTEELAQAYVDKHDPKSEDGRRRSSMGCGINEMQLDEPDVDVIDDNFDDFDWDQFDRDVEFLKNET